MYDADVMLLTGAGASIPLGIPGMRGMAEEFEDEMAGTEHAETYELLRGIAGTTDVENILELANAIERFSGDGDTESHVRDFVEVCISPRGGSDTLDKFDNRLADRLGEIRAFRTAMYDWIARTCLGFDRSQAEEIYGDIVTYAAASDTPIFTTNYDAVLDYVAAEEGITVRDNFYERKHGREYWDETLESFRGDGLKLIKLHGSVQWHADPSGTIEKIYEKASHNRYGDPVERLVIFPTRFKDIYQRNYFPLYSAYTRTLGRAKVLIVIGHSLRDEYLRAAIRERLRRGALDLIYVGPNFQAKDALLEEVRGTRESHVVHLNHKIQNVYPLLIQTLAEKSPEEMRTHISTARADLSSGRKEKIDVDDLPVWVEEGQQVEFLIELETIVGGGSVEAVAIPDGHSWLETELELDPARLEGWPSLNGKKSTQLNVKTTVPRRGADEYELEFRWRNVDGTIEDTKKRKFRIRSS